MVANLSVTAVHCAGEVYRAAVCVPRLSIIVADRRIRDLCGVIQIMAMSIADLIDDTKLVGEECAANGKQMMFPP